MILSEIKKYLTANGEASVATMSKELGEDKSMVQAAVDYWVDRGSVTEVDGEGSCSSCCSCNCGSRLSNLEVKRYRWKG